jgi:hypothetical protein
MSVKQPRASKAAVPNTEVLEQLHLLDLFKNPMVLKQVLQNVPHFAVFYRNLFKN